MRHCPTRLSPPLTLVSVLSLGSPEAVGVRAWLRSGHLCGKSASLMGSWGPPDRGPHLSSIYTHFLGDAPSLPPFTTPSTSAPTSNRQTCVQSRSVLSNPDSVTSLPTGSLHLVVRGPHESSHLPSSLPPRLPISASSSQRLQPNHAGVILDSLVSHPRPICQQMLVLVPPSKYTPESAFPRHLHGPPP